MQGELSLTAYDPEKFIRIGSVFENGKNTDAATSELAVFKRLDLGGLGHATGSP